MIAVIGDGVLILHYGSDCVQQESACVVGRQAQDGVIPSRLQLVSLPSGRR